jgi:cysteinyl-tRNA synthetase
VALRLYNVRTKAKEPFAPRDPRRVGVYVCGLTVYDHMHIGHARTAVSFEVARRWLEHHFPGAVRFVQNVTDVDDKIIARAKETGISPRSHAAKWDELCAQQVARLGVRAPDEAPHVTQSIPGIIQFIQGILGNGFAYGTPEGNVYFDVPKYQAHAEGNFPEFGYGSLSNRDYREMAAGTRKEVESDKRHPADFALWKAGDKGDHPDANWPSPWGLGRPGWHIECSHMATRSLGEQIDLHGGGQDLVFPHHENEVAQSQAKTGKAPFVNVWMHAGFLNVEGEKMSKSLGNFIALKDALDELEAQGLTSEALRLYYLQTHYRSKIDFSRAGLQEAGKALEKLQRTRQALASHAMAAASAASSAGTAEPGAADAQLREAAQRLTAAVTAALDDDLHTPGALAALFDFQREANRLLDAPAGKAPGASATLAALAAYEGAAHPLTLFDRPLVRAAAVPDALRKAAAGLGIALDGAATDAHAMVRLVDARASARAAKDWARSDAIRDAAKAAGYLIEDAAGGTRWRRL